MVTKPTYISSVIVTPYNTNLVSGGGSVNGNVVIRGRVAIKNDLVLILPLVPEIDCGMFLKVMKELPKGFKKKVVYKSSNINHVKVYKRPILRCVG
jgi:hypothetical protein